MSRPPGPLSQLSPTELADLAAVGHQAGWVKLYDRSGGGWVETHEGFLAGISGLPSPNYNGVAVYGEFDQAELTDALERVAASGLPFALQARPGVTEAVDAFAHPRGMTRLAGMPLMALTEPAPQRELAGLTLRRLGSDEGEIHAEIAAAAFGAPVMLMRMLSNPTMMDAPGVHVLGGDIAGTTVTTAMVDVNAETAWIYNVATLAGHRRRGLGTAVTAATVRAAWDGGATAVFLLSAPMAVHVYAELGFRQLEWWTSWSHGWEA